MIMPPLFRPLTRLARRTLLALPALAALAASAPATAQGFAGLGSAVEGFAQPRPGRALEFPADHLPHPGFRIEWWYLTATLRTEDGRPLGAQWTLFRSATAPGTAPQSPPVWMGHAAVTTAEAHYPAERLAQLPGQAGVEPAPFRAFIDEWQMLSTAPPGADPLSMLRLSAAGPAFHYSLDLTATGPLVAHGAGGYSVKSPSGQASHYYSQPFYEVRGSVTLPSGRLEVSGEAWLDREWSSQPLAEDQEGWDWVSLSFTSGARLMGFALRGSAGAFTSATWIRADGTATPYGDGALRLTPLDDNRPPTRWRVELPAEGLDAEITALNPAAWMPLTYPYWEGPVEIAGSHSGRGYLEMTGYPPP